MWDPFAQKSPTGGYPWRIEGTSTTKTYIKNITNREQYYVAFLSWENGGRYMIGMKGVASHQTIEIDVKNFRDEQIPDQHGVTIPLDATSGQLKWSLKRTMESAPEDLDRDLFALIGRTEQIDVANGISSNYACQNWCESSYKESYLTPTTAEAEVEVGQPIDFKAYQNDYDPYGVETGFYLRLAINTYGPTTWISNTTSVATINSSSTATAIAPGTTTITATWQDYNAPTGTVCDPGFAAVLKEVGKDPTPSFRPEPCAFCAAYSITPAPSVVLTVKPTVTAVTSDADTKKITNVLGNQSLIHFVTPKGTGDITLTATLSDNSTGVLNDISWDGATESGADPLVATLSRGTAAKKEVKIKYKGKTVKELRVWIVWATIASGNVANTSGSATAGNPAGPALNRKGGYSFTHTILPATIITDSNRPNFGGQNSTSAPGGNHPIYGSGFPLSGGANAKWDSSRQLRYKTVNPFGISANDTVAASVGGFPADLVSYPASEVEGTDDSSTADETNDPYANSGVLTGYDEPNYAVCHRAGNDGDTFEWRIQFREFTRLEIEGNWYRISDYYSWKFHFRFIKEGSVWVDNDSTKSLDNLGF